MTDFVVHLKHSDYSYVDGEWIKPEPVVGCDHCETMPLLADIHAAWTSGSQAARDILWSIQDGYGEPGFMPPQGYDWSGVRDSTPDTIRKMHAAIHA